MMKEEEMALQVFPRDDRFALRLKDQELNCE